MLWLAFSLIYFDSFNFYFLIFTNLILKMNLHIPRQIRVFANIKTMLKLSLFLKGGPIKDSRRLEGVKKCFSKKKFHRITKILDFFEHTLILTKYLVPCMFELTDIDYSNLILKILPLRCFLFKIFCVLQNCDQWN